MFCNALKFELIEALKHLPFSEREIEWYKTKIEEYIERYNNKMEVSLSGGVEVNENELPTVTVATTQQTNLTNEIQFPLEFEGKIYSSLKEICKNYNIKYSTVWGRINERGLSLKEAIFTKITPRNERKKKKYNVSGITFKGKYYPSISQLAEEYGIARATLANRINKGWDIDRAVNEPPQPVGKNVYR